MDKALGNMISMPVSVAVLIQHHGGDHVFRLWDNPEHSLGLGGRSISNFTAQTDSHFLISAHTHPFINEYRLSKKSSPHAAY